MSWTRRLSEPVSRRVPVTWSTVVLVVLFVGLVALYLAVRPPDELQPGIDEPDVIVTLDEAPQTTDVEAPGTTERVAGSTPASSVPGTPEPAPVTTDVGPGATTPTATAAPTTTATPTTTS